jgi:hypothetical protein
MNIRISSHLKSQDFRIPRFGICLRIPTLLVNITSVANGEIRQTLHNALAALPVILIHLKQPATVGEQTERLVSIGECLVSTLATTHSKCKFLSIQRRLLKNFGGPLQIQG